MEVVVAYRGEAVSVLRKRRVRSVEKGKRQLATVAHPVGKSMSCVSFGSSKGEAEARKEPREAAMERCFLRRGPDDEQSEVLLMMPLTSDLVPGRHPHL